MSSERRKLRGFVRTEDKRTERFFRRLLDALGFNTRNFRFVAAPDGRGAADAWVAKQYVQKVNELRSKSYQASLRLIAVRDGDNVGVLARKRQLDAALQAAGQPKRSAGEGFATPVPARNIETWLLALLGEGGLNEKKDFKIRFERKYSNNERQAHRDAAAAWSDIDGTSLASLRDGKAEVGRLGP